MIEEGNEKASLGMLFCFDIIWLNRYIGGLLI